MHPDKIPIGISTCLLGENVRYNGGNALDRFLRDTLGVKRVNACIYPGNPGSVGLARRLGFTVVGQRSEFFRGEEIPHDLYELVLDQP